jgi:hypothetical protein
MLALPGAKCIQPGWVFSEGKKSCPAGRGGGGGGDLPGRGERVHGPGRPGNLSARHVLYVEDQQGGAEALPVWVRGGAADSFPKLELRKKRAFPSRSLGTRGKSTAIAEQLGEVNELFLESAKDSL